MTDWIYIQVWQATIGFALIGIGGFIIGCLVATTFHSRRAAILAFALGIALIVCGCFLATTETIARGG